MFHRNINMCLEASVKILNQFLPSVGHPNCSSLSGLITGVLEYHN